MLLLQLSFSVLILFQGTLFQSTLIDAAFVPPTISKFQSRPSATHKRNNNSNNVNHHLISPCRNDKTTHYFPSPLFVSSSSSSPSDSSSSSSFNTATSSINDDDDDKSSIRSMKVRDIKNELQSLGVSTTDVFEKDELVKRLITARRSRITTTAKTTSTATKTTTTTTTTTTNSVISTPLRFVSLTPSSRISTSDSNVYIRPSEGSFPTITLTLPSSSSTMSLLVDTGCTGVVLRPETVGRFSLPTFQTPVTMTAAGGGVGGGRLVQLDRFGVEGVGEETFGPLPAVVQDVGALPMELDGIIGLSFLHQFPVVEFDMSQGTLHLHRRQNPTTTTSSSSSLLIATAPLKKTRLGLYSVDVTLDDTTPVRILVDTGAASSLLNWKGVSDMSLSQSSELIQRNDVGTMGAVGADNVALDLTHRFVCRRRVGFGTERGGGVGGIDMGGRALDVDIGTIPILDAMGGDVGGILGSDVMTRCDVVRFEWMIGSSSEPMMSFYGR